MIGRTSQRRAFTLTEMIVVIAIIVLMLLLAIPAIRAITGTRSIAAAENQLSAVMGRARQDALALQDYRGVLFYLDPATDRVVCALVRNIPQPNPPASPQVYLDVTPNRDFLVLPPGIGVQAISDGTLSANNDRYIHFNQYSTNGNYYGGVILFDANGRLVQRTYGFVLTDSNGNVSGMSTVLGASPSGNNQTYIPSPIPSSQFGFVAYDRESFHNLGYTDIAENSGTEVAAQQWLDTNSTPFVINRFNATLIKGE